MTFEEARVYGSRYYVVYPKLVNWLDIPQQWTEMEDWCEECFGARQPEGVWIPNQIWYTNNARFIFRRHEDATMFALRWC